MAVQHLQQRRAFLNLAKTIVADREKTLAELDASYRKKKKKLLFMICLTIQRPIPHRRERLTRRLENLSKVSLFPR
jgi:mRNA-degrading endonuclease RelE of RelBE toxin-antitoxin system